jgi:DNA repair photolyase
VTVSKKNLSVPGRGAGLNPKNRFERLTVEPFEDDEQVSGSSGHQSSIATSFYLDNSKTIIACNDSPDIIYNFSVNPYRGCEHGCIYCYARPYHEYLGFSSGLDFETKILVKMDAPILLEQELLSKSWKPEPIALSGATDCYQPIERKLELTRKCLEVFLRFKNPIMIITKNAQLLRDLDLLQELASMQLVRVTLSISTLKPELARILEPRTSAPYKRLEAIAKLKEAGIPTGILVSPVIPGLTDEEIPSILSEAAKCNVDYADHTLIRLPLAVKELFVDWLQRQMPDSASKIIGRMKQIHGGKIDESRFGLRMTGEGKISEMLHQFFEISRKKCGINNRTIPLRSDLFTRGEPTQGDLF